MTDIRQRCRSGQVDLMIGSRPRKFFLCKNGVRRHWDLQTDTKEFEVRLHDEKPNINAHRFLIGSTVHAGADAITIKPENGEDWSETKHNIYGTFAVMLQDFQLESGKREGWMEIYGIYED